MTVGIVGLGLIGGSFAKAYAAEGHTVYGADRDRSVLEFAVMSGVVAGELQKDTISQCDLILIALYPRASIQWLEQNAARIRAGTLVLDCCGVKREVCAACFPLAQQHGFDFLGGHPMAGTHNSGYAWSRPTMFKGAPMVLVPQDRDNIDLLQRAKDALAPAGFGRYSVTSAEKHDEMIAFTSQMAHLVSNAYIKSPAARAHKGFSAGSYKDLTRVAWLNSNMWAELFLENKDYMLRELDILVENLVKYKEAIQTSDLPRLEQLLEEGKRIKEEVDGR